MKQSIEFLRWHQKWAGSAPPVESGWKAAEPGHYGGLEPLDSTYRDGELTPAVAEFLEIFEQLAREAVPVAGAEDSNGEVVDFSYTLI